MFGIGPMLPVIPAADNLERSSKKVRKRKHKHDLGVGSHELAEIRRFSTSTTECDPIKSSEEYAVKEPERSVHHQRDLSLTVDWNQGDLERMATELHNEEISDLELSLFAFWIKAKNENYLFARELVRELALDQGYNIDRITNTRVRKLLQEVHDVRPRSVLDERSPHKAAATSGLGHDCQRTLTSALTPVTARETFRLTAIEELTKKRTNSVKRRDPQYTSTWATPLQNQTQTSDMRRIVSTRAVTSPLTARMDTLPPSLRLERERAVQEAARATMASTDGVDYPPNTPDRPAPLSVKSRGSRASDAIHMPDTLLRSVSTPVRSQAKNDLSPIYQDKPFIMAGNIDTPSLVSSSTTKGSVRSMGDVFGTAQGENSIHSSFFTDRLNSNDDGCHGTNQRYTYKDADFYHQRGPFQLDTSDVASESSYGTFQNLVRKNKGRSSIGLAYDGSSIGEDSFDALESYVGTEDEDEHSLLESASVTSEHNVQTQYHYAVKAPPLHHINSEPAPTLSRRRANDEARRKSHALSLTSPAINFHRPLPLRSYESEATMFPTAGIQISSSRNRAKSVTSIVASRRPATEIMPLPPLPGSHKARNSPLHNRQEDHRRDDSYIKISERVDQYLGSVLQCSSSASTLSAFPIPPMDNPVGELPMLVSHAVSPPETLHATPSQRPMASVSLEDTYRAITKVNLVALLQRTRARGEQLEIIEWDKMSSFERAWREMNDVLLVTVYGRKDILLSETDVEYIDCIARELRDGSADDVRDTDWVRHIFEDGA